MAEKFDLIFSLGATPVTSQLMKELGLQIFQFPFDTISGSDFLTRMSMFLLDCNDFMEQKNIAVLKDTPVKGVTQYKDLKTNFIYPFDFNDELPIENSFPAVKQRYNRYIKNLRLCINSAKKILIVYVENPLIKEDDDDTSDLVIEASQKLQVKYPNKEFKILYAKNDEDAENLKIVELGKHAEKFLFNFYRKFSDASSFYLDTSMLSMIFTDIELKKTFKQKRIIMLQKIIKAISKWNTKEN